MRLLPLIAATFFMVSGGPYGIEDILSAGYLKGLIILLALPLLWSLPTALMIGELASALPEEGGFYVWVRRAMGPFWGYQEAWLSLAASIFDMAIYPTLFVLYLGRLFPSWTAGWHGAAWELGLIALCCIWNLLGAPAVGDGSVGLFVLLQLPFRGPHRRCALARSPPAHAHFLDEIRRTRRPHHRHSRRHVELHGLG